MKVAIAQINCSIGDVSANLAKIAKFTQQASTSGCQMIVLPEMVDTGYEMTVIREKASTWQEEPFKFLQQLSAQQKIYLIGGLSEREGDKIFNSAAIFNPNGELIGKYRKTHLAAYPPLDEDGCISPGDSIEMVQIGDMKCGIMICYDLRFPEISRLLVLNGVELLILCSAWPFPRIEHWKTLIAARAIENQVYFVAANRTGTDGTVTFCGSSTIVDPYGVVVSSAAADREELIIGEISQKLLVSVRNRMPIFQHRRDDIYNQ